MPDELYPWGETQNEKIDWLKQSVPKDVWQSQSGASILRDLNEQGFQLRTSVFYDTRREVLNIQRYEEQIKQLRTDSYVPSRWFDERDLTGSQRNFLYQVEIKGWSASLSDDERTEANLETRYLTIASDEELSIGETEGAVLGFLDDLDREYDFDFQSANVFRVLAKRDR